MVSLHVIIFTTWEAPETPLAVVSTDGTAAREAYDHLRADPATKHARLYHNPTPNGGTFDGTLPTPDERVEKLEKELAAALSANEELQNRVESLKESIVSIPQQPPGSAYGGLSPQAASSPLDPLPPLPDSSSPPDAAALSVPTPSEPAEETLSLEGAPASTPASPTKGNKASNR